MSYGWFPPWRRRRRRAHRWGYPGWASANPGDPDPNEAPPTQPGPERVGAITYVPEGTTSLEALFSTEGNQVCMFGEPKLEMVMPIVVPPPGFTPYPVLAQTLHVGSYTFFLEPSEVMDRDEFAQAFRRGLIEICGITAGFGSYGPRVKVNALRVLE